MLALLHGQISLPTVFATRYVLSLVLKISCLLCVIFCVGDFATTELVSR